MTAQPAATASTSRASESAPPDTAQVTSVPAPANVQPAQERRPTGIGPGAWWPPSRGQLAAARTSATRDTQASGLRISGSVGQVLGALPEQGDVVGVGQLDGLQELLALLVLAHLGLQPHQPLHEADGAVGLAALVEHVAEPPGARDAVGGGPVHGDVAVALEHAHQALHLLEDGVLLGPGQQGDQASLVEGAAAGPELLDGPPEGHQEQLGVGVERAQAVVDQRQEVGPQPGHAGELGPVGDLVEGQPQAELPGREGVALLEGQDVGADVVDDVLVVGVLVLDDEHVVLAQHPGRHPPEEGADLGPGDVAADGRHLGRVDPLAEAVGEGTEQALERGQVGLDPPRPVGDPHPGRAVRGSAGRSGGPPAPRPRR